MALAGQTFAALLPLLLVISAVSPVSGRDAADSLTRRLHLDSDAAAAVQASVDQPAQLQSSLSVLGVIVLVISALSFTRAMQRLYLRAWHLRKLALPLANAWGLLWLAAFSAYFSLQPAIVAIFDGRLATVVSLAFSTGLWLMTPWVLVGTRISWRRLLPQALLTAVSLDVFGAASVLYMPHAVGTASHAVRRHRRGLRGALVAVRGRLHPRGHGRRRLDARRAAQAAAGRARPLTGVRAGCQTAHMANSSHNRPTTDTGWATFAGVLFLLVGIFHLMWGFAALANDDNFISDELLFGDLTLWGIFYLALGAAQLGAAYLIARGRRAGQLLGLVLACLSATNAMFTFGAYPIWAAAILALDVLVIYGLAVHGDDYA